MYRVSCHLISAKMLSAPKQRYCFQWTATSPVLCLVSCRSTCMLRWANCLCRKQFINERNAETAQSEVIDMGKYKLKILSAHPAIWIKYEHLMLTNDEWEKLQSPFGWLNARIILPTKYLLKEKFTSCVAFRALLEQYFGFSHGECRIWPDLAQWTWTLADYHKRWW